MAEKKQIKQNNIPLKINNFDTTKDIFQNESSKKSTNNFYDSFLDSLQYPEIDRSQPSMPISSMPQSPPRVPSAMPPQNVIRNAGIQMMPEEPSDDSSNFLGSLIAQGITGIGTGLMGGDSYDIMRSANVFQNMRDRQANEKRAKLLTDPKSKESQKRRMVFKNLGYDVPEDLSYTDLNDSNVLQGLRSKQMEQPKLAGMTRGGGVGQVKPEKEKKNPFQKEITEVDNRATMTIDALDQLKENVEKYGTYNPTGPQNNIRNQLVTSIAADYNKVKDPNSTVRGEEAKAVADNLGLTMFSSKESAIASIEAFKKLVQKQKNTSISKYENLPSQAIFDDSDRFIIQEYRNNPNDPKIKETYNNMLESKGMSGF
jgi:hypothetical protein